MHQRGFTASNIWGIGSAEAPQDSLVHYNGTRSTRLSAPALKNAEFNGIAAISGTDVWAVGGTAGGEPPALVVNWNGKSWKKVAMPWKVEPGRVIPEGSGGLWITTSAYPQSIG
jgi:hypothetical protein